jgi:hypothetical protein
MADVAAAFIGPDDIAVGLGPNVLALSSATRSVVVRQIAEPWQMREVIATLLTDELPHEVLVKVSDLMQPMKRAVLMRDKDGPIAAVMSTDLITVHAKADQIQQKGSEEVDAQYRGPSTRSRSTRSTWPTRSARRPARSCGSVHDQEKRPGRPWHVVLTSADDEGSQWQHLLMPLKLRG